MSKYAERVAAGIAVLNKAKPGWHTSVNLDTLDLESITECVLGQVFGGYSAGTSELSISDCNGVDEGGRKLQADYGFDLYVTEYQDWANASLKFQELTNAWVDQIREMSN